MSHAASATQSRFALSASSARLSRAERRVFCPAHLARRARRPSHAVAMAAPASPPTYLLLTLDYVEDILEKRDPYRAEHIAGAKAEEEAASASSRALQNPTDKGVFVFKDCDEAYVKNFVESDAYYKAGLVPSYTIRPWMIVVGA